MAAEAYDRAADLIELAIPAMRRSRHEVILRSWLEALPDELIRVKPALTIGLARTLLARGELEGVETHLRDAERWLDAMTAAREGPNAPSTVMVVEDEEEFRRLPSTIAIYRSALAQAVGDVAGTEAHARRALDLVGEDDHFERGGATYFLALASWTSGDLETAHRSYADAMVSLQKAGHVSDVIAGAISLAGILIAQGRLREAMNTYEWGLQLATQGGAPVLRGAGDIHVGMSELFLERDQQDLARQHLLMSKELGEHAGRPQNPYRWCVAMARLREAEGDPAAALDLLHEAERLYVPDHFPNVRPLAALTARVWVAQGRLGEALGWAHEQGLSADDDLSYLREFEHITLARLLLAQSMQDRAVGSTREAVGLLERLLQTAEEGSRTGSVIQVLVLLALAHRMQGDVPAALVHLERALTLAEPEGYVRVFVDEGPSTVVLLEAAARHGTAPNYVGRLLAALGQTEHSTPVRQALVEPLSARELEVLRLLATDLDGPAIARELVVSLHTLRSHTKSIYAKLGVNNRRAAVRRGEELDLLSRTRDRQPRPIAGRDT
jgi:LuxR family maltose regulon positive regulatory protein